MSGRRVGNEEKRRDRAEFAGRLLMRKLTKEMVKLQDCDGMD